MAVLAAGAALEAFVALDVVNQVIGQLVGATIQSALAPELLELQQESFRLTNTRALDPASSVDAYVKGHRSQADSMNDVAAAGYSGDLWRVLAASTGQPPPLDFLTEAWRRGYIPQDGLGDNATTLQQGIYESLLKNKWFDLVLKMQYRLPDPGTVVEGWLRAQLTEVEARAELRKSGIDEATGTLMFKASGRPISPQEAYSAFHRGLIPMKGRGGDSLTLEQAFLESDLKDKWLDIWLALQEYLPPPRTITALLRAGSISQAEAADLFKKSGLSEHLAGAYIADATHQKQAATKDLAKADVLRLYTVKEITQAQAEAMLKLLGYTPEEVGFELGYQDFKRVAAQVDNAVTRLRTLYVAHKLDKPTTQRAIDALGLDPKARDELLSIWDQERINNVTVLTAAQLVSGAKKGFLDPAGVFDELQGRGYDARDAYVLLADAGADVTSIPPPGGILGA